MLSAFDQKLPDRRKVGDTLTAIPEGAAAATYQWLADGKEIKGETDATLLVTEDYIGQAISVTVTAEDGEEATSAETDLVTADLSFDVALVDNDGLQADGTALVGDVLAITYGSTFGTVSAITWYVNGAVQDVSVPGAGLTLKVPTTRSFIGEVYAIVENTDKERAKTNSITVTDVEQPIEVSDIDIINDYDTPTLTYAPADADAIMTVTMSKAVAGDLYIYKESTTKYGNGNNAFKINAADFANADDVDKASQLTAKKAVEVAAGAGGYTGIYFKNSDGTTTYLLKVKDANMAAAFSPVRGTTYKAVFDQEAISTDNIGATTRADVTVSDPFTAPYVIAPESIALTSHSAGSVPKITFYDAEGEVLTWLGNPAGTQVNNYGISNVTTYGETGSTKAKAKKNAQGIGAGESGIEKGVFTGDTALNIGSSYFWATVTTTKGIFGAKAETLETEIVEGAEMPLATMNLVDDSTNPKDAVITFTKLKTPGTVYVLQGTAAGAGNNGVNKFDADDVATYVGKADVEKGDTKVTISDALESYADSATSGRFYTAYFVPENTEDYSIFWTNSYDNTKQKVKDAEVSNNLVVAQIPKSIAYNEDGTPAETVTTVNQAYDKTAQIIDTIAGGKIEAFDQFGDKMATAQAAKTVTSCTAVNNTLTTTEDANAQFEIHASGAVSIYMYRDTDVDAGDGFDVTILGSTVKVRATNYVAHPAGTGYFSVALGSDTVVATTVKAAKSIVSDYAAETAAVGAGTGPFTLTGTYVLDEDLTPVANTTLTVTEFTLGTMVGPTEMTLTTNASGQLVVGPDAVVNTDGTVTMKVLGKTLTLTSSGGQAKLAVTSWA